MNQITGAQKLFRALTAILIAAVLPAGNQSARAAETHGALRFSSGTYQVAQAAGSVKVPVDRVGGSYGAVTVQYWTQSGTATGANFTAKRGTLRWAGGDASAKTISVPISTAVGFSGTKMFHVLLGGATSGASLGTPHNAVVSIQGKGATAGPSALSLSSATYAVSQSAGSVTVTVRRTGSSSGSASVAYATASGTAIAGTDFTSKSGTLQWASGDSAAKTFRVAISNAKAFSGSKTFGVALSHVSTSATLGSPGRATVTITGSGGGSSGGGSGGTPTHVMVIKQGTSAPNAATMFSCGSATLLCPGFLSRYTVYYGNNQSPSLNEIGWKGVSGATNYAIYRSVNGGPATLLATISAATAASNYAGYRSSQSGYGYLASIDSAYTDSSAVNVVSDKEYPPVNVTGSVRYGSNVLIVGAVNNNTSVGARGVITAGQGIGGPGIPAGTTIAAFGSGGTTGRGGTGTYQLSRSATATEGGQRYGTQYFANTSYTYYVKAQVSGAWSSPSAFATLPYVVDGQYILSGGVFGGPAHQGALAPATTPLGNSHALEWAASAASSVIGVYAGNSAADQALNVGGYSYLNVAFYTSTPGINFAVQTEVPGDNVIFPLTELSNFGFGNLAANAWTTYKIPLSDIYIDKQWSGSQTRQNSLYKVIFQYDYGAVSSTDIFMEMWFSVN